MNVKNIIFLFVGAGIGCSGTYFIMKDRFDKLMQEESEEIKAYYEEKYAKNNKEDKENDDTPVYNKEETHSEEAKESKNKPDIPVEPDYDEIINKLNYNQYSTKTSKKPAERPYLIDSEQYINDMGYVKKIVSYFEDDEVCMFDDTHEIVENVSKDLGNENIKDLTIGDEEEIYIRNEQLGIDYNVVIEHSSYEDFVYNGEI